GPGLQDHVRFARGNHVARSCALLVGGKATDVILMTVSSNNSVQFSVALFLDVLGHSQHQVLAGTFRLARTPEVDQYVTIFVCAGVMECQQETIAETYLVAANS